MASRKANTSNFSEVEYYAMLAKAPVHHFTGSNVRAHSKTESL